MKSPSRVTSTYVWYKKKIRFDSRYFFETLQSRYQSHIRISLAKYVHTEICIQLHYVYTCESHVHLAMPPSIFALPTNRWYTIPYSIHVYLHRWLSYSYIDVCSASSTSSSSKDKRCMTRLHVSSLSRLYQARTLSTHNAESYLSSSYPRYLFHGRHTWVKTEQKIQRDLNYNGNKI